MGKGVKQPVGDELARGQEGKMDENHISEFVERELSEWNKGNNMLTRVKELIRGAYLAGYAEAVKDNEAALNREEEQG